MSDGSERGWIAWMYRPANRSKLWWGFAVLLALTVIAQLAVDVHGYFGLDGWWGFNAVYGFASCAVMVVFARLIGFVLKRPEDYYNGHD